MKIAVIGIGNVLCGDEGIGIHIVNKLKYESLPSNVEVYDCDTDIFAVLEAMDGARKAIIIDAMHLGYEPGTIRKFSYEELLGISSKLMNIVSFHQFDLASILRIAQLTGVYKLPDEIVVFGVEVKSCDYSTDISNGVRQVIPKVIDEIIKEIQNA
jgi:hydrogenase maturation protease